MLMKLDTSWLIFALVAVTMIAYILSLGLDAAMKDDGFGAVGNAVIITAAFFSPSSGSPRHQQARLRVRASSP